MSAGSRMALKGESGAARGWVAKERLVERKTGRLKRMGVSAGAVAVSARKGRTAEAMECRRGAIARRGIGWRGAEGWTGERPHCRWGRSR